MPADGSTNVPRPPAPIPNVRPATTAVTGAIQKAAKSTGANFDYLLATAKVESNLDPNLTMRTSTATGLFQFLEQTWLGVMKTAGGAFGFAQYSDAITQTSNGRYVVEDPKLRAEMMKLRKDPAANAVMGGVITQQNAAVMAKRIGRKPTEGELYVGHFFGPYAGSKVIQLASSNPSANAAEMFPAAARANRSIFYDRQGNARTVAGVHNELIRRYQVAKARPTPGVTVADATPAPSATQPSAPTAPQARTRVADASAVAPTKAVAPVQDTAAVTDAIATARAQARQNPVLPQAQPQPQPTPAATQPSQSSAQVVQSVFHSLFETQEGRGPVSPVVADLWTPREDSKLPPASQPTAAPVERAPGRPLDLFRELSPLSRALFDTKS
jgi:hypothetical protein